MKEGVSKLWHGSYHHSNYGGLKLLSTKNKNKKWKKGLPQIDQVHDVCEACQLGKQHRDLFPHKSSWSANQPIQLVHSDLCGSMLTSSLRDSKYFISFIDDYSR